MPHSSRIGFNGRNARISRLASATALTIAGGAGVTGCADGDRTILLEQGSALAADARGGSGATVSNPEGSGSEGSSGANGASMVAGAAASECVPDGCPAANLLGVPAPGCCQEDGTCGALIALAGFSFCAPSAFGAPAQTMRDGVPASGIGGLPPVAGTGAPLPGLGPESVNVDPLCPGQALFGAEFAGCCDVTGLCGLSSQPFAAGGPFALPGLEIPLTCIAAGDVPLEGLSFLPQGAPAAPLRCGGAGSAGSGEPGMGGTGDGGDASTATFPGREIVVAFLDFLLEQLTAILEAPDDGASEEDDARNDDGTESGTFDEDGEVGADAGASAGG